MDCILYFEYKFLFFFDFFSTIERDILAKAVIMQESVNSSTMVSSLERSLELAIHHYDGLSDKESQLKKAQSNFKTATNSHRRTASVSFFCQPGVALSRFIHCYLSDCSLKRFLLL